MNLRPQSGLSVDKKIKVEEHEFMFLRDPLIFANESLFLDEEREDTLTDYGSDSDDINYLITYPWYHRCRLGKKNKIFVDYDWEEETYDMEERAMYPNDESSSDEYCDEFY